MPTLVRIMSALRSSAMARVAVAGGVVLVAVAAIATVRHTAAQSSLDVRFGENGLERVAFGSTVLEDTAQFPADAFHIWHMKATDLAGNVLPQYGWGENHSGRSWDAAAHAWTTQYPWGSIRVQLVQHGNTLDMDVTERNNAGSGVILDGAAIFPLALHFPSLPAGFGDASYPQLQFNTTAPSVALADWGAGEVVAVAPSAAKPLYSGWMPTGQGTTYTPLISGTAPDGLATFQPHNDRPVLPGQTDSFTVSLRFAASGTPVSPLVADATASWARTWPPQIKWTDRRILGTAYLASAPQGTVTQPGGFPNNPRRYFNDGNAGDFDVRTTDGLAKFQKRVLAVATTVAANLRRLNAQGAITWDIEGEQYPQDTSYVCSPDLIAKAAPEMESVVADTGSPYHGMKLDDAYFRTIRDAGFRVGVCVRPQHFVVNPDGTAQQTVLPDAQVEAEIVRKMRYAHDRWGATLFYLDSTVEANGAVLDAAIFQQAAKALPDSLLIPEETTPKHYAYTAAFKTFLFHGDLGTDPSVYGYYPRAFSANLINDVDPAKLAAALPALTAAVSRGDVLMVHADYWHPNNDTVVSLYAAAHGGVTPTAPAPAPAPGPAPGPAPNPSPSPTGALVIVSPGSSAVVSGAITVSAQVGASLDAAGSYLMVDGVEIGTRRVTGAPYQYALDTSTLANGQHTLQLWGHTTANETVLSATVPVVVRNASAAAREDAALPDNALPPGSTGPNPGSAGTASPEAVITYPRDGQGIAGVVEVAASIAATLDAAGSFLMVDGAEAGWRRVSGAPFVYELDAGKLSAGPHVLQVWAHDVANRTILSNKVQVAVAP